MAYAVAAWLVAAACVGIVFLRVRRLAALELPSGQALLERVHPLSSGGVLAARAELDELLSDVDRTTSVGADLPRALSRVTLASGTALALFGLISSMTSPPWASVLGAFFAGVAGTICIALLGRIADARARRVREHWSAAVRRAWVLLDKASH